MNNVINILDFLEVSGEDVTKRILSTFYSGNEDVDDFVHKHAIEFAKQHITTTYFTASDDGALTGVFALTNKIMSVPEEKLSNSQKKRLIRQATKDDSGQGFVSAAFLIAQFGKNTNIPKEKQISGKELMSCCWNELKKLQRAIGGNFVWLECESNNQNALLFYTSEKIGFKHFAIRSDGNKIYNQLLQKL